jgi:MoaA/NifB/PqqE/SkfB family radical SAM enzyme
MLRTIHWQLLFACNLECEYCWNHAVDTDLHQLTGAEIARILEEIAEAGQDQIVFTGGEPFLAKHIMETFEVGVGAGLKISAITHAGLLTEERIKRLIALSEIDGPGGIGLVISLDAADPEVNSRTRGDAGGTRDAIERLNRLGAMNAFDIFINTVLTTRNINEVDSLLDFSTRMGIHEHRLELGIFTPHETYYPKCRELDLAALPPEEIDTAWRELEKTIEKYRSQIRLLPAKYYQTTGQYLRTGEVDPAMNCRATESFMVINPLGQAYSCFGRPKMLANLRDQHFSTVLEALQDSLLQNEVRAMDCVTPRCMCSFFEFPHRLTNARDRDLK